LQQGPTVLVAHSFAGSQPDTITGLILEAAEQT
jgi:hypothetical protein